MGRVERGECRGERKVKSEGKESNGATSLERRRENSKFDQSRKDALTKQKKKSAERRPAKYDQLA